MPSSALAIAISRALTRPSRARRARRRSSSEPMSSRIANADIVGSLPPDHNICYSQPAFDATLLASQHQLRSVLPVPYFHVTVTEQLRAALRRHQIDGYGALMKAAAAAILVLARDPRWVGGTVGVLAVLHTWTQRLIFHPHVHCLVTGGGLSDDGAIWHPAGKTFLFPKTALAALARARFRDAFARLCPAAVLPPHVWHIPWVVHITPWGQGQQAALDYLARYAFRIAITNNRILAV